MHGNESKGASSWKCIIRIEWETKCDSKKGERLRRAESLGKYSIHEQPNSESLESLDGQANIKPELVHKRGPFLRWSTANKVHRSSPRPKFRSGNAM